MRELLLCADSEDAKVTCWSDATNTFQLAATSFRVFTGESPVPILVRPQQDCQQWAGAAAHTSVSHVMCWCIAKGAHGWYGLTCHSTCHVTCVRAGMLSSSLAGIPVSTALAPDTRDGVCGPWLRLVCCLQERLQELAKSGQPLGDDIEAGMPTDDEMKAVKDVGIRWFLRCAAVACGAAAADRYALQMAARTAGGSAASTAALDGCRCFMWCSAALCTVQCPHLPAGMLVAVQAGRLGMQV
jgi:hypothetical protein